MHESEWLDSFLFLTWLYQSSFTFTIEKAKYYPFAFQNERHVVLKWITQQHCHFFIYLSLFLNTVKNKGNMILSTIIFLTVLNNGPLFSQLKYVCSLNANWQGKKGLIYKTCARTDWSTQTFILIKTVFDVEKCLCHARVWANAHTFPCERVGKMQVYLEISKSCRSLFSSKAFDVDWRSFIC